MIFFTLGTQLPFDRMTRAVDEWCAARGRMDVFGQISDPRRGGYRPVNYDWVTHMPPIAFDETLAAADFVVAHAGMGSILSALGAGKLIVVMPRRAMFGEHRNDHQAATVARLADRPGLMVAADETALPTVLDEAADLALNWISDVAPPFAEDRLIAALRREILSETS